MRQARVRAAAYAANGEWRQAGIMAAGIAPSAVGAGAAVVAVKAVRAARATGEALRGGTKVYQGARRLATLRTAPSLARAKRPS
jgi:hypothetical protein